MALDAYPAIQVTCEEGGSLSIALLLRDGAGSPVLRTGGPPATAGVDTWDWYVHDERSVSPEAALYSQLGLANDVVNGLGVVALKSAVTNDGYSRTPQGHTFHWFFNPTSLFQAAGGGVYTLVFVFRLLQNLGQVTVRVPLLVEPRP